MKKTSFVILCLLFFGFVKAQELEKTYYESGKLRAVGQMKNGKETGEWKVYYENGNLWTVSRYIEGKLNGESKDYHENGQLSQIGSFTEDKRSGQWKRFYESGELREIRNYTDGKRNGESKDYHENGQLSQIGSFTEDKRSGQWKRFYESGQLRQVRKYTNDILSGEWEAYHENGQLKAIGNFDDGKETGEWKVYDETGRLLEKKTYVNGKVQSKPTDYLSIGEKIEFDGEIYELISSSHPSEKYYRQEYLRKNDTLKDKLPNYEKMLIIEALKEDVSAINVVNDRIKQLDTYGNLVVSYEKFDFGNEIILEQTISSGTTYNWLIVRYKNERNKSGNYLVLYTFSNQRKVSDEKEKDEFLNTIMASKHELLKKVREINLPNVNTK